jgi:hypothetical protein
MERNIYGALFTYMHISDKIKKKTNNPSKPRQMHFCRVTSPQEEQQAGPSRSDPVTARDETP